MDSANNEWHSPDNDDHGTKPDTEEEEPTTARPSSAAATGRSTTQIIRAETTAKPTGTAPVNGNVSPAQPSQLTPDQQSPASHAVFQQGEGVSLLHTSSPYVENKPKLPVPSLEGTKTLKPKIKADDPKDSFNIANRELKERDSNNLAYLTSTETTPVEPPSKQHATNANIELNTTDFSSTSTPSASLSGEDNSISQSLTFEDDDSVSPEALHAALSAVMSIKEADNFLAALGMGPVNSVHQQSVNNTLNAACSAAFESQSQPPNEPENAVPDNNGQARIVLSCEDDSHPFQTRCILLTPNIECKVGRVIAKIKAEDTNAIFDCKVMSRNHAVLWFSDDGKFWIRDTNSSNGTFVNDNKLGTEAAELQFNDIVKFGVRVVENVSKEMHSCIIACVELYLPDGCEANTTECATYRSANPGEQRISPGEMHLLNQYMQEASQREEALRSKLYNVQGMLDAARESSGKCWKAMIGEDQLLDHINMLEKKLVIMKRNVPESALRNEVIKLLDDGAIYQSKAKRALRRVYQERCEAMQMLSKMEAAHATADNECKLLREQIINTSISMHDVNVRLLGLESEYNSYKEEAIRQLQEAREEEEMRQREFNDALLQRELECEDLRRRIDELTIKEVETLQKEAIEKLDQAIAAIDLDEDDDEDGVIDWGMLNGLLNENDESVPNMLNNMSGQEKEGALPKEAKQVVSKSTILKKSDLTNKEGPLEIFGGIGNEPDSSNEENNTALPKEAPKKLKIPDQCSRKLQFVENNLKELESQISAAAISDDDEEPTNEVCAKRSKQLTLKTSAAILREVHDEFYNLVKHYEAQQQEMLNKQDKEIEQKKGELQLPPKRNPQLPHLQLLSYQPFDQELSPPPTDLQSESKSEQLKPRLPHLKVRSYQHCDHEISRPLTDLQSESNSELPNPHLKVRSYEHYDHEISPPPTDLQSESKSELPILESVESMGLDYVLLMQAGIGNIVEDESCLVRSIVSSPPPTITETSPQSLPHEMQEELNRELLEYDRQISDSRTLLEQKELQFQHTLEMMQVESEHFRDKVVVLSNLVETLRQEKEQQKLHSVIEKSFNDQIALVNDACLQREEELILYKEQLEKTKMNNLQLQSQIEQIQLKALDAYKLALLTFVVPGCAAILLIVALLLWFR